MVKVEELVVLLVSWILLGLVGGRSGGPGTLNPCRKGPHFCPRISTKLLSRYEAWQLKRDGRERTFTLIHRGEDRGSSWTEAVVRESRRRREKRSQARTVVSLDNQRVQGTNSCHKYAVFKVGVGRWIGWRSAETGAYTLKVQTETSGAYTLTGADRDIRSLHT